MGGRGAKGAMASEVVSASSGVSSITIGGGSGGGPAVSIPVKPSAVSSEQVQLQPTREQQTRPEQRRQERRDRERPLNLPGTDLADYQSVYTDKTKEYTEFRLDSEKRFADKLNAPERNALGYYKGSGYKSLNAELRGFQSPTAYNQGYTKTLDSAMKGKSLGRDIIVYRGFTANFNHEVGLVYQDKGFMSTSLNPNRAFGGQTFLKIHASAKTRGAFIESKRVYSKNAPRGSLHGLMEHEVLFARGSHYMVVGKSKVKTLHGEREAIDVVILE